MNLTALLTIHRQMQRLDSICASPKALWGDLPDVAQRIMAAYHQANCKSDFQIAQADRHSGLQVVEDGPE